MTPQNTRIWRTASSPISRSRPILPCTKPFRKKTASSRSFVLPSFSSPALRTQRSHQRARRPRAEEAGEPPAAAVARLSRGPQRPSAPADPSGAAAVARAAFDREGVPVRDDAMPTGLHHRGLGARRDLGAEPATRFGEHDERWRGKQEPDLQVVWGYVCTMHVY